VVFGLPSMTNRFYGAFDFETLGGARKTDYRNAFQIDRDRIIYAHAFRKLQSKTQVFLSGEDDFYRTRLTHSMEVAQIGRSICHFLLTQGNPLGPDFFIDPDLVEAICLAHDMGHPPFGHSGERTLQELMRPWGGFEGNAQTVRLLVGTMYEDSLGRHGMQPTRALLDGVLKYKTLFSEFPRAPANHFLYDDQEKVRRFVFAGKRIPAAHRPGECLNQLKSIECQIMDWADDAAYSVNDIVDGVAAGFLTIERIEAWAAAAATDGDELRLVDELLDGIRADRVRSIFSGRIGLFITGCRLRGRDSFMGGWTHRYRYDLVVGSDDQRQVLFYKRLANDLIFESPWLQQMEHKARKILCELWDACSRNYIEPGRRVIRILPPSVGVLLDRARGKRAKAREICDWLAGLTDGTIMRTYRRLFDPEFSSIRDLS
jgi:dGTPase